MWLLFFVVVIVIALLMVFLMVAIRVLADQAKKQLNRYFLKNLETYDRLAENKSVVIDELMEELAELEHKKTALQERVTELRKQSEMQFRTGYGGSAKGTAVNMAGAELRDKNFLEDYAYIRQNLRVNPLETVKKVMSELDYTEDSKMQMCRSILEKLPQEQLYDILILDELKQIEYLKEMFTDEEDQYLLEFVEEQGGKFDLLSFRTVLKNYVSTHESIVYLRTGTPEELKELESDRVKVLYDAGVHEGVRISFKNKVYDFSL